MSRIVDDILDGDPLLTVNEVGQILRIHSKTVGAWIRNGKLPAIRTPGRYVLVRASAVRDILNAQT